MSDFDQFFNDRAGFSSAFNAIQGSRQRLSLLESQEKALAEQLRAAQDAATHADRMEDHAARMEEHATRVEKLEKQRVEIERCRMDIEIQERKAASDKSGELRWMRRLLHEAGRELLSIRQSYPANGEPAERPDSELNARLAVLQATDELISERDPFDELVDMGAQSSFHEDMVQYIEDAADAGVCSKSPLTHVRDAVSFKADVIREMIGFMRACRKPSELLRAKVIYQFTETEIQAIDRDSRQLLGALRPTLTSFVPRLNETESRFDIDLNSDHMKFLNQLTGDLEPFLTLLNGEEMTETHLLNVANCEGEHFVYLEAILKWGIDQCAGWSESVNRVRSDLENIHAIAEQGNYQTAEGLFAKAKSTRGIPGYNYSILRNSINQWKSAIDTQVQTWNSTLKVIDHFIQNSSGIKELTLVYRTMARFKLEFQQVGEFLNYATSLEVSEFKNTCLSEGNRATSAMQARLARAKAKQTAGRVRFAVWLLFGALLIIGLILVIRWHIKETEI